MEIFQWETGWFLEIDFLHEWCLKHELSLCSYNMLMEQNFDPLYCKLLKVTTFSKQPPRLDILSDCLWEIQLYVWFQEIPLPIPR